MHVGHVDLQDRALQNGQCIPDSVAVVGPCPRVDEDCIDAFEVGLVDALRHGAFKVRLEALNFSAECLPKGF